MSDLLKLKAWLASYSGLDILSHFHVDYTDQIPSNGGIFPNGRVEISRRKDIFGNVKVENQLNFGIYCVFPKAPGDEAGAVINAEWVEDFQKWVQQQSVLGLAPAFGDYDTANERITAQNGTLYETDTGGTAMYMVQLAVRFKNYYEVK